MLKQAFISIWSTRNLSVIALEYALEWNDFAYLRQKL